jgi:5'-3' exonuclease
VPTDEKKMTSLELEQMVKDQIFKRTDLTEPEKQELAAKKLKAIVDKQLREKGEKLVEAYQDKVKLTQEGWK